VTGAPIRPPAPWPRSSDCLEGRVPFQIEPRHGSIWGRAFFALSIVTAILALQLCVRTVKHRNDLAGCERRVGAIADRLTRGSSS
jgi:hypothetical protein